MGIAARFDLDNLVASLLDALNGSDPLLGVRDVLERLLRTPSAVQDALPADHAELTPLYTSPELTVMKAVWSPSMALPPHNHEMWGAIGVYGGREVNEFYRRGEHGLEDVKATEFDTGEVGLFGREAIHKVTNPLPRTYTGAIHVYGGDFLNEPRSVWLGEPPVEEPATGTTMQRFFVEANEATGEQ